MTMFKAFFLNQAYELEYTGRCLLNGKEIHCSADSITIDINGTPVVLDRKHACLYTHYEFNPFVVPMDNVDFVKVTSRVMGLYCEHVPVFKTPAEIGYGFRLIPGYHRFAVNREGVVISYRTGNILSVDENAYGYPCVNIYDCDKGTWRSVVLHILLARAFIDNDNPAEKIYVNHIDGVKQNITVGNLEWVTPEENNRHARDTGLNNPTASRACTVHDLVSGEREDYSTVTKALRDKGITRGYYGKTRQVKGETFSRVYGKRYVITEVGEDPALPVTNTGTMASRSPNKGPYQAIQIDTGQVWERATLRDISVATGVPYDHVRSIVETSDPKMSMGFHFRVKQGGPWSETYEELVGLKHRCFEAKNDTTGVVMALKSLQEAVKFFSSSKQTIYRKLANGESLKGWALREVTNEQSA